MLQRMCAICKIKMSFRKLCMLKPAFLNRHIRQSEVSARNSRVRLDTGNLFTGEIRFHMFDNCASVASLIENSSDLRKVHALRKALVVAIRNHVLGIAITATVSIG